MAAPLRSYHYSTTGGKIQRGIGSPDGSRDFCRFGGKLLLAVRHYRGILYNGPAFCIPPRGGEGNSTGNGALATISISMRLVTAYLWLAKIRLTVMVLVTAAVGFVLASNGQPIDWAKLALTLLGTGLAVVGAATFNQLLEIDRDAVMERTRDRPLPAGLISPGHAFLFAMATTAAGLGILNEWVNPLTALLGLGNVLVYTLVYTPLKPRTSLNTLVGSICGALPPVMGWAAAANGVSFDAAVLGLILFLWQVPHFLSFVWLYREDYARAGYQMLPVTDPGGRLTCLMIVLYSLALMPVGLLVTFRGLAGFGFGAASLLMGLGLFLLALQVRTKKTEASARRMFLASIAYLPLLLLMMVADRPSAPTSIYGQTPNVRQPGDGVGSRL